jgi:hypothetical protein
MRRTSCCRAVQFLGFMSLLTLLCLAAIPHAGLAAPVAHETPQAYCTRVGNDDALRTPPPSLASAIHRLFDVSGRETLAATYYRCAGGEVLVCWVGANLPCGKANTNKELPAAAQWCESHANSNFIPMVVTGHNTLYSWRCAGRTAIAGEPVGKLDSRGFFQEYWKKVQPGKM